MEKGDFNISLYVCFVSEYVVDCGILVFFLLYLFKVYVKLVLIQMEY